MARLIYDGTSTSRKLLQDEFYKRIGFEDYYNTNIRDKWDLCSASNRNAASVLSSFYTLVKRNIDIYAQREYIDISRDTKNKLILKYIPKEESAKLNRRIAAGYGSDDVLSQLTTVTIPETFNSDSKSCVLYGFPNIKVDMVGKRYKCRISKSLLPDEQTDGYYCCELYNTVSNRWYKFSPDDLKFEYPDLVTLEKNFKSRLNRTPEPGKTVKMLRKNKHGIPQSTRGIIKSVTTIGNEEYGKYVEVQFPNKTVMLRSRNIVVINPLGKG